MQGRVRSSRQRVRVGRTRWLFLALLPVMAGSVGAVWRAYDRAPYTPDATLAIADTVTGATVGRDTEIAVWRSALAADTGSALVLSQLAGLHAQRAREQGTYADWLEAEALARHALARRTHRNGAAAATLVSALLAQHRVVDAHVVARALVEREPDVPAYRAILGEVSAELGDTLTAREAFASVHTVRRMASVAPRLARWWELTGRTGQARALLTAARDSAALRRDLPRETQAWYALRLGDLERRAGHPRRAAACYRDGLRAAPGDARLLAAMARVAADAGAGTAAVWWAERAVAARTEPATLLSLAAAWQAQDSTRRASGILDAIAVIEAGSDAPAHRESMLFALDHGRSPANIRRRALEDLRVRRDVYGLDLAAWASYRDGHMTEARDLMTQALALGTNDEQLQRHAARIFAEHTP